MKAEVQYCQHLVCMMDLMGQKEMYKVLESYPIGSQTQEFEQKLTKFINVIESLLSHKLSCKPKPRLIG